MTKKDYVEFAKIVRMSKARTRYGHDVGGADTIHFFEAELADLFARDNPRFNREQFLKACELNCTEAI